MLAGGQSLLPVMKLRVARPALVVDVSRLPLRGVEARDGELHLGPLTTWAELADVPELENPALAAIAECARGIGDLQVRNRGTVGGSIAHADPASDMPAVLLALGATLTVRSTQGERRVALDDFLHGPFTTDLGSQELITDVCVPIPAAAGSAYVSIEHPASGFALAGAAAVVRRKGTGSLALTGVAPRPTLVPDGTDPLELVEKMEIPGDWFAGAEYRRHLAATVVRRAIRVAGERAGATV